MMFLDIAPASPFVQAIIWLASMFATIAIGVIAIGRYFVARVERSEVNEAENRLCIQDIKNDVEVLLTKMSSVATDTSRHEEALRKQDIINKEAQNQLAAMYESQNQHKKDAQMAAKTFIEAAQKNADRYEVTNATMISRLEAVIEKQGAQFEKALHASDDRNAINMRASDARNERAVNALNKTVDKISENFSNLSEEVVKLATMVEERTTAPSKRNPSTGH